MKETSGTSRKEVKQEDSTTLRNMVLNEDPKDGTAQHMSRMKKGE